MPKHLEALPASRVTSKREARGIATECVQFSHRSATLALDSDGADGARAWDGNNLPDSALNKFLKEHIDALP